MKRNNLFVCLVALLVVFASGVAFGQEETGNCYVEVKDNDGSALPGVTVTLTGGGAPRVQVTNDKGQVRFLGLSPDSYQLAAALDGFSSVEYPSVVVSVGRNTSIAATLTPAVEETITVTSESPLLDERKVSAGTSISQVELEKIPTARDPWSILSQAAGVMVDRINVGGNESGQQSNFRGQGVSGDESDFLVDGVQITDMSAIGSSPTYYDFDQFQEVQLSTGGTDVTKNTMGVGVNLVTKRGTNEFRGSARFLVTDGDGYFGALSQSSKEISSSDLGDFNRQQGPFARNQIARIQDLGFEAGGPVLQDKFWAWASWGQNDINNIAGGGGTDRTVLENTAIKLNAQFGGKNSAIGSFNNGDKLKFGRGARPSWDASATWNQRGPTGISKFEDTHVFSSNFFGSAQWSKVDGGFSLLTQCGATQGGGGCPATPAPGGERNTNADGFRTNNGSGGNSRPTEEVRADASYFFNTGNLNHEIKFGARMREAETSSAWSYPGRNIFHNHGANFGVQDPALLEAFGFPGSRANDAHAVYAYRQGPAVVSANYDSFWAQDTISSGNWTFNVGFRYDAQDGANAAASVAANPAFPDLMPGLTFDGNNADGIGWDSISPRMGVTYALGAERKTLLRGSYAQFPEAMSLGNISRTSPVSAGLLVLLFLDEPGGFPAFYDDGEPTAVLQGAWGFNPAAPTSLSTSNKNDPGMDAPMSTEIILGVEHAFLPEFVAGASFTWRDTEISEVFNLFEDAAGNVSTIGASNYSQTATVTGTLPDGTSYSYPYFSANDEFSFTGGSLLANSPRGIDYQGISVNATKRLANKWMVRGFFNYNLKEDWDVPDSVFLKDDPNRFQDGSTIDGSLYNEQSGGSGKTDIFLSSSWQFNLNGLYQVAPDRPWGFNVAGNITAREGYPIPYYRSVTGDDGIGRRILATPSFDTFRNDDIFSVDLRLDKEFATTGNTSLTFSLDAFNVLDETFVLQRFDNLASGNAEHIEETMSPRVVRLGVRLNWR